MVANSANNISSDAKSVASAPGAMQKAGKMSTLARSALANSGQSARSVASAPADTGPSPFVIGNAKSLATGTMPRSDSMSSINSDNASLLLDDLLADDDTVSTFPSTRSAGSSPWTAADDALLDELLGDDDVASFDGSSYQSVTSNPQAGNWTAQDDADLDDLLADKPTSGSTTPSVQSLEARLAALQKEPDGAKTGIDHKTLGGRLSNLVSGVTENGPKIGLMLSRVAVDAGQSYLESVNENDESRSSLSMAGEIGLSVLSSMIDAAESKAAESSPMHPAAKEAVSEFLSSEGSLPAGMPSEISFSGSDSVSSGVSFEQPGFARSSGPGPGGNPFAEAAHSTSQFAPGNTNGDSSESSAPSGRGGPPPGPPPAGVAFGGGPRAESFGSERTGRSSAQTEIESMQDQQEREMVETFKMTMEAKKRTDQLHAMMEIIKYQQQKLSSAIT